MKNDKGKTRPVAEVRLGNIRGAIWRNDSKNGIWYNATFQRTYRDEDELCSSDTFGRDDLLALAKVVDLTHSRIFELQQEDRKEQTEE